ncbi:MAG: methanogenesis marker 17 protein [archaeon]|nr:methanogenesis marker 17 protein [archaeon]
MATDTVVVGPDAYGNEAYKRLYEELLFDVGKLAAFEKSYIYLEPKYPLFVVSVRMKARPSAKTIGKVASTRSERDIIYVSISDEMYAPGILQALWNRYGRDNVQQIDRLDISVRGAKNSFEVDDIEVESQDQPVQEVLAALYRVLPEGIRNRRTRSEKDVITVAATEEKTTPYMLEMMDKIHTGMLNGGEIDV